MCIRDRDKIAVLKNSAVNRVSLGVQTFDDKMLKKIGRGHLERDIYENIDRLKLAGFDNISIDLIYALPGQTMDQVKDNVAKAIALDVYKRQLPNTGEVTSLVLVLAGMVIMSGTVIMKRKFSK